MHLTQEDETKIDSISKILMQFQENKLKIELKKK